MKQILIFLISVILFSCSESEIRYHIDKTTSPTDTLTYLKSEMKPLNGIMYCEFGENGNFINGKKNGIHKTWYEDGQLKSEGYKIDGKEDGIHKTWYENGQLEFDVNFKDGKRDGLYKLWYKNGQLQFDKKYINDTTHGMSIHFSDDGYILSKGEWENSKQIGIHYYDYYFSDKIKCIVDHDINIMRYWNKEGDLFYEGKFDQDKFFDLNSEVESIFNLE